MKNITYLPMNSGIPNKYLNSDGESFPIEKNIDFIETPAEFIKKNPYSNLYKTNLKMFFCSNNYKSLYLFYTHTNNILNMIEQITSSYTQNELIKFAACQKFGDSNPTQLLGIISKYTYKNTIEFLDKIIRNKKLKKAGDFIYTDNINNSKNIIGHLYSMYI